MCEEEERRAEERRGRNLNVSSVVRIRPLPMKRLKKELTMRILFILCFSSSLLFLIALP